MAFHVTQCPHCESTFNTNANILGAASGRVRCGFCLQVFDGIQHILAGEEPHQDDLQESVFIGNYPADYFNPQSFLSRGSLTQPVEAAIAVVKPSFASRAALFSKFIRSEKKLEADSFPSEALPDQESTESDDPRLEPPQFESESQISEELSAEPPLFPAADTDIHVDVEVEVEVEVEQLGPNQDPTGSAEAEHLTQKVLSIRPEDVRLSASFSLMHLPARAIAPEHESSPSQDHSELEKTREPKQTPTQHPAPPLPGKSTALDASDIEKPTLDDQHLMPPELLSAANLPTVSESESESEFEENTELNGADASSADLIIQKKSKAGFVDQADNGLYFEDEITELEEALLNADEAEFTELFEIESDAEAKLVTQKIAVKEANVLGAVDEDNETQSVDAGAG
ncbi:MAG: putative Zn finger-like uncharacterized protein, partial [Pseudohongiellaceae bacterium]